MSEAQREVANECERAAARYAAELLEKYDTPAIYSEAVELISLAYIAGSIAELKAARDSLRGDAAPEEYHDYLRPLPTGGAA